MKLMKLFSLGMLVSLASCALVDPQIPESKDFEDEELRQAMQISKSEKEAIIASTHNFFVESYFAFGWPDSVPYKYFDVNFDLENTPNDKLYENMIAYQTPLMETYISLDDDIVEFHCLGYVGIIQKSGSEYLTSGSYFDLAGSYLPAEFAKGFYDSMHGDYIYSFGMLEELKRSTSGEGMSMTGLSQSVTVSDSEWYKKLVCSENKGNGNFTVNLGSPITVTTTTTTAYGKSTSDMTYDYVEVKMEGHRVSHDLMHGIEKDTLIGLNGEKGDVHMVSLNNYSYNVDRNSCFKI